jgi:hypothetical protein
VLHFPSRTGEWGRLNFPNDETPILVYAKDGEATWAPLTVHDGKSWFKVSALRGQIRVMAQSLEQNGDGEVALDQLIDKLRR